MSLKKKIIGDSYKAIGDALETNVRDVNGTIGTGEIGAPWYAALSNGEIAALVLAWKRAAARSHVPTWPGWYDLLLHVLGWRSAGDRFVDFPDGTAKKYASARADDEIIELFWRSIWDLAAQLDGAQTPVKPLIIDYSFQSYRQAARDAWHEMERLNPPPSPIPGAPGGPPMPDKPDLPMPPGTGGKKSSSLWLLIALLLVATRGRSKKKRS